MVETETLTSPDDNSPTIKGAENFAGIPVGSVDEPGMNTTPTANRGDKTAPRETIERFQSMADKAAPKEELITYNNRTYGITSTNGHASLIRSQGSLIASVQNDASGKSQVAAIPGKETLDPAGALKAWQEQRQNGSVQLPASKDFTDFKHQFFTQAIGAQGAQTLEAPQSSTARHDTHDEHKTEPASLDRHSEATAIREANAALSPAPIVSKSAPTAKAVAAEFRAKEQKPSASRVTETIKAPDGSSLKIDKLDSEAPSFAVDRTPFATALFETGGSSFAGNLNRPFNSFMVPDSNGRVTRQRPSVFAPFGQSLQEHWAKAMEALSIRIPVTSPDESASLKEIGYVGMQSSMGTKAAPNNYVDRINALMTKTQEQESAKQAQLGRDDAAKWWAQKRAAETGELGHHGDRGASALAQANKELGLKSGHRHYGSNKSKDGS